jgi:hypothetical protein
MQYLKIFLVVVVLALILFFRSVEVKLPQPGPSLPPPVEKPTFFWTDKGDYSPQWNNYLLEAMPYTKSLLNGSADILEFCPTWASLDIASKSNVIIQLISAIAYYESGLKLADRMMENMGIDSVTKLPVYSEGLLQLSYQDQPNYNGKIPADYCKFAWDLDQHLPATNLGKTILNPRTNLQCGLMILDHQVQVRSLIGSDKSYWSVLRPTKKLTEIKRIVQSFPACLAH